MIISKASKWVYQIRCIGLTTDLYCRKIMHVWCINCFIFLIYQFCPQSFTSKWFCYTEQYHVLYRPGGLWLHGSRLGHAGLGGNVVQSAAVFPVTLQLVQPLFPELALKYSDIRHRTNESSSGSCRSSHFRVTSQTGTRMLPERHISCRYSHASYHLQNWENVCHQICCIEPSSSVQAGLYRFSARQKRYVVYQRGQK